MGKEVVGTETALLCGHLRSRIKNKTDRVSLVRKWCAQNIQTPKYKFVYMNCIPLPMIHGKLLYAIRTQVLDSGKYHDYTHTFSHMFIRSYHICTYMQSS